jgi:hypothetical protein
MRSVSVMPDPIYLTEEVARELADTKPGDTQDGYRIIENRATGDEGRWEAYWELVIRPVGLTQLYRAVYGVGLTEYQDNRPFEGERQVVFKPVRSETKTITVTEYVDD